MEEFKERQRAIGAAGDYATLSELITDVGELVVARAGVEVGEVERGRRRTPRPAAGIPALHRPALSVNG